LGKAILWLREFESLPLSKLMKAYENNIFEQIPGCEFIEGDYWADREGFFKKIESAMQSLVRKEREK
jgi:hypothetical protein